MTEAIDISSSFQHKKKKTFSPRTFDNQMTPSTDMKTGKLGTSVVTKQRQSLSLILKSKQPFRNFLKASIYAPCM